MEMIINFPEVQSTCFRNSWEGKVISVWKIFKANDGVIFKSGINDTDLSRPHAQMFDPCSTSPFLVILHMYKMAF